MALCELSGRGPVVKNLVSHSNIKTKSRAHINLQKRRLRSFILKEFIRLKVSVNTLRDIEHRGGLDSYLLKQPNYLLSKKALKFKNRIRSKIKNVPKNQGSTLTPQTNKLGKNEKEISNHIEKEKRETTSNKDHEVKD